MKEQNNAPDPAQNTTGKYKGFLGKLDGYFGITASGSDFKREIIAGLTTFMAMLYILLVNSELFSLVIPAASPEAKYGAAYVATAIGAVAGTMLMALVAKMPLAQASGIGIIVFIVHTLILGGSGLSYANCLVFTMINGIILIILTVTGLRTKMFEAIPQGMRHAIPVGVGLFIAFIGMQNAGIIVDHGSTLVSFVSFNVLGGNSYGEMIGPLVALLGVVAIAVMSKRKMRGAILWGILGCSALYYALAGLGCAWGDVNCLEFFKSITFYNPFLAFKHWGANSAGVIFYQGFDFSGYLNAEGNTGWTLAVLLITSALALCMIDMFDTFGTLYGACAKGGLLDENGTPIRMEKIMLAGSIATCVGAAAGTSTVTTLVESSSGVAAGGKTGFAALITGGLFFVAMFLSPVARLIPSCATAAALIWVGVLMLGSVTKIDWSDPAEAVVAFLTAIVMLLGYSIAKGIGTGIIAYILVKLFTGQIKQVSLPTYIIGALFLATFLLT